MRLHSFYSIPVLVLLSLVCGLVAAADDAVLFDAEGIADARINGFSVEKIGTYTVWIWSLAKEEVIVEINEKRFVSKLKSDAGDGVYSWKRLGSVDLNDSETASLRLYSDDLSKTLKPKQVGYLALNLHADWDPAAYFALTKIFNDSARSVSDKRLGILRSNRDYYPFPDYQTKDEWLQRKRVLKTHLLNSLGLYPLPEKTPLKAKIFDVTEREDYTVAKAYFESYPGFYVTGNLYRPKGKSGPFPGVVSPHGHWSNGRLENGETGSVPGRAINLARQGCVVFTYDMVGYVDSKQINHQFGGEREWLWGISLHGLQLWNGIRAVDFLLTLDDVDPDRIACTGASGGGTQTFSLMAVDERVRVAAPVNMISAHFQGGCLCENGPNLRLDANNVEFGAMMAPRPLLMVSASGDWTNETPRVEYPAIRSIYKLFDAPDHVYSVQIDAPHNYNKDSREAVYAWFGKWLLGEENTEKLKEKEFTVEEDEALRVFPGDLPEGAVDAEELTAYLKKMSEAQLQEIYPNDESALLRLRRIAGTALRHTLSAQLPKRNELVIDRLVAEKIPGAFVERMVIGRVGKGDRIPGILVIPNDRKGSSSGTVLVHEEGKAALTDLASGKPGGILQCLLDEGHAVFMPDVFLTGEFHSPFEKAIRDKETAHFLTYNQTDTALRTQDILTSIAFLNSRYEAETVNLVGVGDAGLWCLLAAPLADSLHSVVVDAAGFDGSDDAYMNRLYIPGLRRAGDLRAAQALLAPTPLVIYNTGGVFDTAWARKAYETAGVEERLEILEGPVGLDVLTRSLR